jgi:hypothetical protein
MLKAFLNIRLKGKGHIRLSKDGMDCIKGAQQHGKVIPIKHRQHSGANNMPGQHK